ncbi:LysR substrate-binding domain-containing protein [Flavobacterium sp. CAU 1735]|uniref:LysR substrate-binding domain-containing protein n=1 Tax=Flavobacterium sp. CAU 1735 TaxID=3140361 RepID=UPI003261923E
MELRQLKYFIKAKELLNFTAAAEALNISQSTLSQQIKQLEIELDTPLFNRIGKRITLTEAGDLFYSYAQQTVNKANSGLTLLKDLSELKTGALSIGVTYGLRHLLTPALIAFLNDYPGVTVKVYFGTSEELHDKLIGLHLDLVLAFEEIIADENLTYTLLFESPLCLVAALNSPLADKKEIDLTEISQLPIVLPAAGYSTRKFVGDIFAKHNIHPKISAEINDIPTLLDLVKSGKWYTILAKTTVAIDKELAIIPINTINMTRRAMIITHQDAYQKKAARYFLERLTAPLSNFGV